MKKILFLLIFLIGACNIAEDPKPTPRIPISHTGTLQGKDFTLYGQAKNVGLVGYERLPRNIMDNTDDDIVKIKVKGAQLDTAGFYIAFDTDAKSLTFTADLRKNSVVGIIPDENESAFQLLSFENSAWKDTGSTVTPVEDSGSIQTKLEHSNPSGTEKKYMLLFPTYNGIKANADLTLTLPPDAKIYDSSPFKEETKKPILIYGTSVTHGAAGSSPIKTYTMIVSLESEREVINLGFDGSAYIGNKMADYLADIPSYMFFIDPTLNLKSGSKNKEVSKKRLRYMINEYRKAHPKTPIIIVSQFDRAVTGDTEGPYGIWVKDVVDELKNDVPHLYFLSRLGIVLDDTTTVDVWHPNDAGMILWANEYLKIIEKIENDEIRS